MSHSQSELPAPGQRWSSDAEPDLGLGTVLSFDGRVIQMHFPATGDMRSYALQSMPLSRVRFDCGERIEDHRNVTLIIEEVIETDGLIEYRCLDLRKNPVALPESQLNDQLRFNRPKDKLLGARLDKDLWFSLRYQSWLQAAREARSPVLGLKGARVGLIPHQLYIAKEVSSRANPRVLLADEVGLGKTIEAGLILHRLLLTERVSRVLIVVPEPLLHQWLVEMLRRFNLRFALFDQDRFDDCGDVENPFETEQRILLSQDWLCSTPAAAKAALKAEWDLLIVDEAHHLHWTENESSLEYDLIQALSEQIKAVLLLTATPEQLGRAGHFGRLRLLDPQRFKSYDEFVDQSNRFEAVAAVAGKLLKEESLDDPEQGLLADLLGEEANDSPARVLDKLVDRHGTGRVLFRNTRAAISGFPERRLITHELASDNPDALNSLDALLDPEAGVGQAWTDDDPRIDWLIELCREHKPEKILLICSKAQTAVDLRGVLAARTGMHAAMFHEFMSIVERDRAAAYFADPDDGTQLLICSEIGSEGRNFQFAHHLVLFDLPLESELLEQRIGRLDRIGQTETVKLHVPYLPGTPGEALKDWYHAGLAAFEAPSPAASAVQEELLTELIEAIESGNALDALIERAATRREELSLELENGRDHLLEMHSHRADESAALIDQIEETEHDRSVVDYMNRYWDAYGVEQEAGPGQSLILHPGNHMLHDRFPEIPGDGTTVTFQREDALAHEDRQFITWEHPMVTGAINMLLRSDLGSAAATVVQREDLKPGTLLLELIYIAECAAPPEMEVKRYLPSTPMRLLLDARGGNHAKRFSHDELNGDCLKRDRRTAKALIKSQEKLFRKLLDAADVAGQTLAERLVSKAQERADLELGDELKRLKSLADVSDSIGQDEIDFLELRKDLVANYLSNTRARLDAARLIIAS